MPGKDIVAGLSYNRQVPMTSSPYLPDPKRLRQRMVVDQLQGRGISDARVLEAMGRVPRHLFVPDVLWMSAYTDYPLSIGYGQPLSQPFFVAFMSQELETKPGMRVLEIGTGSGYQSAVLSAMGLHVVTVERVPELYENARNRFEKLGIDNVVPKLADGTLGWPSLAPYDRIIVTAGAPNIPAPLLKQLADPGIMLIPVGANRREQKFVKVVKAQRQISAKVMGNVAFVDLIGDYGWQDGQPAAVPRP